MWQRQTVRIKSEVKVVHEKFSFLVGRWGRGGGGQTVLTKVCLSHYNIFQPLRFTRFGRS